MWNAWVQVLLFVGLPTGLLLAVAAVPSEGPGLVRYGWAIAWENPGLLALLAVSSAAVNVTSFLAIRFTSSLMFKVTGCMKNVAVVWLGVLMGDKVRLPSCDRSRAEPCCSVIIAKYCGAKATSCHVL